MSGKPPASFQVVKNNLCLKGHTECVEELIKAGSKLEVFDGHYGSALHSACYGHKTQTARAILSAGGNVNAIMNHTSLLHIAAAEKTPALVQLLLDFGANAHARNNRNKTPLDLVDETDEETRSILEFHMSNPRTLAERCRWVIRCYLGAPRLNRVNELGLPKIINNYLLYR